jgi:uncharacterized repeat protein (TIGR03803 family)
MQAKSPSLLLTLAIASIVLFMTLSAQAQTFSTLVAFDGSNGEIPYLPLTLAANGNLYGTAPWYKVSGAGEQPGTVFEITPEGDLTTVYDFCGGTSCADGASNPSAALIPAGNGDFYGATLNGGSFGGGTIFEVTPDGVVTVLYNFCSLANCADGFLPNGLVLAANGNLYGTTIGGGAGDCQFSDVCGTVFELTPSEKLTTLYSFCSQTNCADGMAPNGLIQGADGNFYGTTFIGGEGGGGTIFQVTPQGAFSTLYDFCVAKNCSTGAYPAAGLVQGSNGMLYGTTPNGGTTFGTVFAITTSGKLTPLHVFCTSGTCPDGAGPYAGLVQGSDGNLYGTTIHRGGHGHGTIFSITPSGTLTTLYSFCALANCADGSKAQAALVEGANGTFYGSTTQGGDAACRPVNDAYGCGTIFSISVESAKQK